MSKCTKKQCKFYSIILKNGCLQNRIYPHTKEELDMIQNIAGPHSICPSFPREIINKKLTVLWKG